MNDEDFVQRMKYSQYSEEGVEEENYYIDNHIEELDMFFENDYAEIQDFFSPELNISELIENEKPQYIKATKFYEKKLSESSKAETYASKNSDKVPAKTIKEPQGKLMVCPDSEAGLGILVIKDPERNIENIRAVFPFITKGHEYPCSIRNVKLDYYGNEALIEAFVDEEENLLLTFYDIHYLDNRSFYNPNDIFKFRLVGLVSYIEVVENDDLISVTQDQDENNERYELYSVVKAIEKYSDNVNGEKVFRITISLGYTPDGEDIPLDIYVTKRSLGGKLLPEIGDNIYAEVHIHGYLTGIEK